MNQPLIEMLAELESQQLRVELAPLNPNRRGWNEGGMKRVVTEYPPKWWRSMCGRHPSSRGVRRGKFDTRLRRAGILSILRRLAAGLHSRSKYAGELRRVAEGRK